MTLVDRSDELLHTGADLLASAWAKAGLPVRTLPAVLLITTAALCIVEVAMGAHLPAASGVTVCAFYGAQLHRLDVSRADATRSTRGTVLEPRTCRQTRVSWAALAVLTTCTADSALQLAALRFALWAIFLHIIWFDPDDNRSTRSHHYRAPPLPA